MASAVNDLEAAVMAGRGRIADTMTIYGIAAITADDQGIPPVNAAPPTTAPAAETPAAAPPTPAAEPSDAPVNAAPPTTVPGS